MAESQEARELNLSLSPGDADQTVYAMHQITSVLVGIALANAANEQTTQIIAKLNSQMHRLVHHYFELSGAEGVREPLTTGKHRKVGS
jgi:hypothetical protein